MVAVLTHDYATDTSWGPETLGAVLYINPSDALFNDITAAHRKAETPLVVDVEDDASEEHNLVGIGVAYDDKAVFYFTEITPQLRYIISREYLTGHNVKSDMHKLRKWGFTLESNQLFADTMIKSYVQNSTRESQGLKDLAKDILSLVWPSYKDLIAQAKKTVIGSTVKINKKGIAKTVPVYGSNLTHLPVTLVARYNACDVIATYRLNQYFSKVLTDEQQRYYDELELPVTRLLYDMEAEGVCVDIPYLRDLDSFFLSEISRFEIQLKRLVSAEHRETINFNSPTQVKDIFLKENGVVVAATNKESLRQFAKMPLIQLFQRYREVKKLRSTYSSALLNLPSAPVVHTSYNQCSFSESEDNWGGIRTGRLSSSDPNLQNIPTRTALGDTLRRAFVPREGHIFLDFDYSQIEWRLAAHFSRDERMIEVLRQDKDIYQDLADSIGCERPVAKTMALAMNYNAGGYKVASILQVPNKVAFDYVDKYRKSYPQFFAWKDEQMATCKLQGYITTLFNRTIRPDGPHLAVPYMIQGSAGEVIKMAMLACKSLGFRPVVTVHDELLFEILKEMLAEVTAEVKNVMENIVDLTVKLKVDVGHGTSWQAAKN